MKISRTHKLVLLAALLIAAGSTIFLLATKKPAAPKNGLSYNCYQTGSGWGYDVLVNNQIIIHQPVIPGAQGTNGFSTEQAAGDDAKSVIEKIKSGEFPLFQHQHLQRPGVLRTQSK